MRGFVNSIYEIGEIPFYSWRMSQVFLKIQGLPFRILAMSSKLSIAILKTVGMISMIARFWGINHMLASADWIEAQCIGLSVIISPKMILWLGS